VHDYQTQKFFASSLTVVTALLGLLLLRLKWSRGVDFDLTGFFWLIENFGPLSVVCLLVFCAGLAVKCWIRVYQARL
jgi:hypothetical protein